MPELKTTFYLKQVFLFATVLLSEVHSQNWTRCARYTGWRIANPDRSESVAKELKCVFNCIHFPECLAVDYDASTHTCSYFSSHFLEFRSTDDQHSVIIVENNTAISLQAQGTGYSYTYADAGDVCTSLRGRLMTIDELWSLYYNGYQLWGCGWLQGGGRYYPMQHAILGCGSNTGLMNCAWATLAHAWCKFQ